MAGTYLKLFVDCLDRYQKLNDTEFGRLVRAALRYKATGAEPDELGREALMWDGIRLDIDRDNEAYDKVSRTKSEAGKLGAITRWAGREAEEPAQKKPPRTRRRKANAISAITEDGKNGTCYTEEENDSENGKCHVEDGKNGTCYEPEPQNEPENCCEPMANAISAIWQNDTAWQKCQDKDKDKDKDEDRGVYQVGYPPKSPQSAENATPMSEELNAALDSWLRYKTERRQAYTASGVQTLRETVAANAARHGDAAVIELIRTCMASNYGSIYFDRLEREEAGTRSLKRQTVSPQPPPGRDELQRMRQLVERMGGAEEPS